MELYKKIFIIFGLFFFLTGANTVKADNVGDVVNFNVDKGFDASSRIKVSAVLVKTTPKLYFYVESSWWSAQTWTNQNQALSDLDNLSNEFNNNIYPNLTNIFGSEWNPGIDKDSKITVLFETMNSTEGGYFKEADEYEKIQMPNSNEREMVYLSISNIDNSNTKTILAHEFTHLITFNQKNKNFGVEEDTWLNEARADYSSTILGYDSPYSKSNLQQRVNDFMENPSDSITDWSGAKYDYASVNLFMHYLVDHYGVNILSDSLKSKLVGIASINNALVKNNFNENFSQIFTNWTITLVLNDCSQNNKYCYLNTNLNNIRVSPSLIFLPLTGNSSLSSTNVTKNWSGNWQKIIGGSGDLKLNFSSLSGLNFQVPYITYDKSNKYSVNFLQLDRNGKAEIDIQNFGTNYKSLIIIPSLQNKISGFDNGDLLYPYSFTVSVQGQDPIDQKIPDGQNNNICSKLSNNLYYGMKNNGEVRCLQQFLKNQGADVYPEGLVTGNFGNLTKQAIIRFQEKYTADILTPVGLKRGTGYVGIQTRIKINKILSGV